jgi:hypothetical protein
MSDCWADDDYDEVLEFVEKHLWLFVQQNAGIHKPKQVVCNLAQLNYQELRFLQRIYFLLSEPLQRCVRKSTPRILRHLVQSTDQVITELKGSVRGNVDWNLTMKRRLIAGYSDPTVFVARIAVKTYDLPEMQVLKYLLTQTNHLCVQVLGFIPNEDGMLSYEHEEKKWKDEIRSLYHLTNIFLKNVYLRGIGLPTKITDIMLQRVRCARNVEFKRVYESLRLYRKLFIQEEHKTLRECFAQGVLKPLNRDTLYETYILFLTMEILEQAGWEREHLRLIGYGNGATVHYRHDSEIIRVYYQTLPTAFAENSLYTDLMRKYSIDVNLRRPDMLLEFDNDKRDFKLLEVKRTRDRHYTVESVYKVLGYLKDFEKCFESGRLPHAVLVIWDDIGGEESEGDIVVIRGRQGYRQFIENVSLQ